MRLSRGGRSSDRPAVAHGNATPPVPDAPETAEPAARIEVRPFRRRFVEPKLSAQEVTRQGLVVRMAIQALTAPGAATAFLNSHHADLGGRPLDLAIASEDGLRAVEKALAGNAA